METLSVQRRNMQSFEIDLPARDFPPRRRSYLRKSRLVAPAGLLREPRSRYYHVKRHPFRKDLLWKAIIEGLPEDFLRFFFPAARTLIDAAQKIEFLDKELLQLFPPPDGKFDPLRVDMLMKVTLRNRETVILHCEVQGYRQTQLSSRMYRYFCRLWDKYPQQVTAIAILTDGNPGFRPKPYRETGGWRTHRLNYDYEVYKVLDQSEEDLERSVNPFALVLLTTKAALKRESGKYTEQEYFRRKLELARWLEGKSMPESHRQSLLSFLKCYLPLNDMRLESAFNEQLKERNKTMGIVEYLINEAKEDGLEQGLEQGREAEKRSFVTSLLANTDFDDKKIAALTAVDPDFVRKVRTMGLPARDRH